MNWYVYCANNPIMFVDPLGLAITDADRAAYYSGRMSEQNWQILNKSDQMWNQSLEDDYTTKAIARSMAVMVRQSYDPNYYDDFDYTFGTGESALDFGDPGNYMKTFAVINSDGSGGLARISYSRVEINGKSYLKLNNVRARGFSGRRLNKTGIWGYMGQTDWVTANKQEFSSNDSYIFERANFEIIPDDGGAYLVMGAGFEFQFGSELSIWITLNVYSSNYDDINGNFHEDDRFTSSPGLSGENWLQHPPVPKPKKA